MWAPSTEETYFASMDYTKNVVNIMPSAEMLVTFNGGDRDMMHAKKACLLYAERVDFKELIVSLKRSPILNILIYMLHMSHSNCVWPRSAISDACTSPRWTAYPSKS